MMSLKKKGGEGKRGDTQTACLVFGLQLWGSGEGGSSPTDCQLWDTTHCTNLDAFDDGTHDVSTTM